MSLLQFSAGFDRNEIPVTIAQGASVTFRIERISAVLTSWERLSVQQATDPVATFGEVVLQSTGWNNADSSFLPPSSAVQKGYAFPVVGSNPNDGTLRQGLLDGGVSDRVIYDGDYVIWSADAFTSWLDGDDWFVLNRDSLQRITREESNFLSQITEIDNQVDAGFVSAMTTDALVWLSESPLVLPPFLTPSTDSNNPRDNDDYEYIGGRENRNAQLQFQFSQNRFQSYITIGITPNFLLGHDEEDIFIRLRDSGGDIIQTLNLSTDFTLRDDVNWSNSTVTHFIRNTSINYPFLATIEIVLTQIQRHFRMNPISVEVSGNIQNGGVTESKLSPEVQDKLNANLTPENSRFQAIEARLSPYKTVTFSSPAHDALFLDADGDDSFPSALTNFNQVSSDNPRYTGNNRRFICSYPRTWEFYT